MSSWQCRLHRLPHPICALCKSSQVAVVPCILPSLHQPVLWPVWAVDKPKDPALSHQNKGDLGVIRKPERKYDPCKPIALPLIPKVGRQSSGSL